MTAPPEITLNGQHWLADRLLFKADITLPAGQWTCLLGPSGVGKSTILRLILGLETGGRFDGQITATDSAPLAGRISYMAQSDLLMPWLTVLENIMIGARLRGEPAQLERAHTLLKRVGLSDQASKKPNALSGGMRQRVALARTLMEDRATVLLDEPFSALDAGTRADMQELAAELLADHTVLLVTHDPAEAARLGHQIIVMSADRMQIWPTPSTAPIRAIDSSETVTCHSALLAHIRQVTA